MPSNPDHLPFPPSQESSSSLPLLLLGMFSPLLLSTLQPKTFALFPCAARESSQVPRVSKEHLPQERMGAMGEVPGQPKGEEIRAMPRLPGRLPQEGFPGSEGTKVLRKELGMPIPQSQTGTSLHHFQVIFLAKGRGSVYFSVALIPEGERERREKKRKKTVLRCLRKLAKTNGKVTLHLRKK